MSGSGSRSRVTTRTARPDDLPAVLALVRQHRAEAHAEGVLTGQTPGAAAAAGFRRLLADDGHRVALAVRPDPDVGGAGEVVVGLAILGVDPLSVVLGVRQVTVDNLVVHREHRRCGAGAALLGAAVAFAAETGADHVVAAVGGHEAERLRFLARMGFAPLTTRRIVPRESLARALAAWRRGGVPIPVPRRPPVRRRPVDRGVPLVDAAEG
ncbi:MULTISPECIES: GNAT family N-acetyltransferase [unclassified Geodermatophilus]|uniref:GNAT family N-acetyltransferase n=1 Tax=unclassified Geodermatophilus TaxID=2637632 RepID=UPI003EE82241